MIDDGGLLQEALGDKIIAKGPIRAQPAGKGASVTEALLFSDKLYIYICKCIYIYVYRNIIAL